MTEPIKLPPLPARWDRKLIEFVQSWGIAAVEADRTRQGDSAKVLAELVALIPLADTLNASASCQDLIDYFKGVIADRQRRGEPVELMMEAAQHLTNWLDMDNCECDGYSHSCGKAQVELCRDRLLAAAPQPQQQASEPKGTVYWLNASPTVAWVGRPPDDGEHIYTAPQPPQPPQIPEGHKLVPIEPTGRMLQAAYNAGESEGMVTTTWLRGAIYRAMLEAAPEVKG